MHTLYMLPQIASVIADFATDAAFVSFWTSFRMPDYVFIQLLHASCKEANKIQRNKHNYSLFKSYNLAYSFVCFDVKV